MVIFKNQSIRKRLLTIFVSLVAFSLLFSGGILVVRDINISREELAVKITTLASVLGDTSRAAIIFEDIERGTEILFGLIEESSVIYAVLADKEGKILATYLKDQANIPVKKLFLEKEGYLFSHDYLEVKKHIYLDDNLIGNIYVFTHLKKLQRKNRNTLLMFSFVLLVTLIIVYFIILRLSLIITAPILSLSTLSERVALTDDFSLRGNYNSSDEIGVLYGAFNDMLAMLQKRDRELEKTYNQLLHSEKLSATGRLAASLAHELNNPICGIRNALEIFSERGNPKEPYKKHLSMAIRECNRVVNLIENLNEFHRPSSDNKCFIDPHTAIDEMLLLVKSKFNKRNIVLSLNYAKNLPPILVIEDQFKQVILNLLTNAEEAIPKNNQQGKVTIITKLVDSKVFIRVQDNGEGISEEIQNRIFEPFITSKNQGLGLGLGLSISYSIAKKHGGELLFSSHMGKGSIFKFILPVTNRGDNE